MGAGTVGYIIVNLIVVPAIFLGVVAFLIFALRGFWTELFVQEEVEMEQADNPLNVPPTGTITPFPSFFSVEGNNPDELGRAA